MAEGMSSGSWWGGWLQTAKDKSLSALQFVKNDLAEFSTTMQTDTSDAAHIVKDKLTQETATEATKKVKDGVTSFLGGISKALTVEAEDLQTSKRRPASTQHIFDRAKARLNAIQIDPGTYCEEPSGPQEDFQKWQRTFQLENHKGDISELLVSNAEVRSLYTQLVPSQVSHADYWHRYFYKIYQLKQDEDRKAALMKRADVGTIEADLEWDDDEWGDLEITGLPNRQGNEQDTQAKSPIDSTTPAAPAQLELRLGQASEQIAADQKLLKGVTNEAEKCIHVSESDSRLPIQTDNSSHSTVAKTKSSSSDSKKIDLNLDATDATAATVKSELPKDDRTDKFLPASQPEPEVTPAPPCDEGGKEDPELTKVAEVGTKDKTDEVDRRTPSSDSSNSKELSSVDDDWEKDFDIEVSEEDIRLAQEAAKRLATSEPAAAGDEDDDWENWD